MRFLILILIVAGCCESPEIKRAYIDCVGKYPTKYEFSVAVEGKKTRKHICKSAATKKHMNKTYRQLLFRDIDPNGWRDYSNALVRGADMEDIRLWIRQSPEYKSKH